VTEPILFADVYSGNPMVPYLNLRKNYGFRGLIRKFSMQMGPDTEIAEDLAAARDADWEVVAGYHWADPIANWLGQADCFLRMIDLHKPNGIATDIEHYWPRWPRTAGDIPLPASRILENAKFLDAYIKQRCDLPELKYTAKWFTMGYCPQLGPWIADKASWLAYYLDVYGYYPIGTKSKQAYPLTAEQFAAHLVTVQDIASTRRFAIPTGVTNPKLWQFSSRIILPECRGANYDMSIWLGDEADFRAFFRLSPPQPTIDQRLTNMEVWARTLGYTGGAQ